MDNEKSMDNNQEGVVQRLTVDMLSRILDYAEHPQELADYLVVYMRDLFRSEAAVLLRSNASEDRPEHAIVGVCPEAATGEFSIPEIYRLAEISLGTKAMESWAPGSGPAGELLAKLAAEDPAWSRIAVVPLCFGKTRFGVIFAIGCNDAEGAPRSFAAFEPVGHIVALILRNAVLFQEQERIIAQRSREILRKERKYQALAEMAPVGIFRSDVSGSLIYANERFRDMSGLGILSTMGWDWLNAIHHEDREGLRLRWEESLATHTRFSGKFRFRRGDGSVVWVYGQTAPELDDENQLTGYVGTLTDITDLKMAERTIDHEKEWLAVTLRSIGEGVITTDTAGRVLTLNEAAEGMTGWKSAEAKGRPFGEVFAVLDEAGKPLHPDPVTAVLQTGQSVMFSGDARLTSRDGREMLIADMAAPIRETSGTVIGVVLVFQDVSEQRKLAEALQREQKLESLGVLAGGIAHDFNNLLSGIFGNIERAASAIETGKDPMRFIGNALGVFDRAKALTQQLLTFSKGGMPVRKPTDLGKLVRQVSLFAASGTNVSCRFELAEDLPACDCDENQISQVISNLVLNAVQAMPQGGELGISTMTAGTDGLCVAVKDAGTGISPHDKDRIFDPFFTTKATGHGLGLSTTFSIVQRHGGRIEVDSELGKGSEFRVYLPASAQACELTRLEDTPSFAGRGKILVMDDEEFLRELLVLNLEDMGYRVVSARGGLEAISLFNRAQEQGEGFTAAILDLTIPGDLGGKSTAETLLKIHPGIVLIASSGYSQDPVMSDPAAYGFTAKLSKPYQRKELVELMRSISEAG
jgi:PAS domain S-box-containing protein